MSLFATRHSEMLGAIALGCDRLVHPSVTLESTRLRHRRLIGIMFFASFFAAGSAGIFAASGFDTAVTLVLVCIMCVAAWSAAVLVAATGRDEAVQLGALAFGTAAIAALISAGGGLASPLSILLLVLPFEALWLRRTARSVFWGGAAAITAVMLLSLSGGLPFANTASISAWHWLMPLAYGAMVLPRLGGLIGGETPDQRDGDNDPLEDIIDAVVVRMGSDGDVTQVSEKARSIFGLPPELLFGAGLFDRIHIADRVGYLCALADLRAGSIGRKLELRIRLPQTDGGRPSDNYRHFLVELARSGTVGQALTAFVRENEEIAELRRALSASRDANDAIEIAKGRFLASVSHELRTPLNAIIGFSDMLMHEMFGGFKDPRQKEYVGLVRDSGHHLLAVVNSILDVSKMEAGSYTTNPEPFAFREAVEMCRSMLSLQAKAKSVSLTTHVAAETGEINADKRAVQQMLINLVSNAVKFTPEGGRVAIGGKRIGSRLHFWVSDTGIGIAEDDLSRLGKPFTQVQNDYTRQFEGTGLGLSVVKGLVALHDGTMAIESAVGEGTIVTISLPVDGPVKGRDCDKGELLPMQTGIRKEKLDGALRKAG